MTNKFSFQDALELFASWKQLGRHVFVTFAESRGGVQFISSFKWSVKDVSDERIEFVSPDGASFVIRFSNSTVFRQLDYFGKSLEKVAKGGLRINSTLQIETELGVVWLNELEYISPLPKRTQ